MRGRLAFKRQVIGGNFERTCLPGRSTSEFHLVAYYIVTIWIFPWRWHSSATKANVPSFWRRNLIEFFVTCFSFLFYLTVIFSQLVHPWRSVFKKNCSPPNLSRSSSKRRWVGSTTLGYQKQGRRHRHISSLLFLLKAGRS